MSPPSPVSVGERTKYLVSSVPYFTSPWGALDRRRYRRRRERELRRRFRVVNFGRWRVEYDLANSVEFAQWWQVRRTGAYEPSTSALALDLLHRGDAFVDAGANVGYYSSLAARQVGASGRVYAFEPHPLAFRHLEHNLGLNDGDRVAAYPLALSDAPGEVKLYLSDPTDGAGAAGVPTAHSIRVGMAPFDSLVPTGKVDLVKVDVGGTETQVLRGMRRTLERNPRAGVIVEWDRWYRSRLLWEHLASRFTVHRIRDARDGYRLDRVRSFREARWMPRCNLYGEPH